MTARRPKGASRARPRWPESSLVFSLESLEPHGTHIGEKLPRVWYIVEADLYITSYVLQLTSGESTCASRVSAPGPTPAASCVVMRESRQSDTLCVCARASRGDGVAVGQGR